MSPNRTCGECKHYIAMNRCVLHGKFVHDDDYCGGYIPKTQPITNGDKIIAGGMRAIAELGFGNRCVRCIYSTYVEDVGFGESGWVCILPKDKDCVDGIEAWLNAPAESEVKDG